MSQPRDPIGEYLREKLASTPEPYPEEARPPWRPSVLKIGLASVILLLLGVAAAGVYKRASENERPERPLAEIPQSTSPAPPKTPVSVGELFFAQGAVELTRGGERLAPEAGATLMTGDVLETGPTGSAAMPDNSSAADVTGGSAESCSPHTPMSSR